MKWRCSMQSKYNMNAANQLYDKGWVRIRYIWWYGYPHVIIKNRRIHRYVCSAILQIHEIENTEFVCPEIFRIFIQCQNIHTRIHQSAEFQSLHILEMDLKYCTMQSEYALSVYNKLLAPTGKHLPMPALFLKIKTSLFCLKFCSYCFGVLKCAL